MASGGVGLTYNDGENYIGFSFDKLEAVYGNPGPEGEENMTSLNPTKNTVNFQSSFSLKIPTLISLTYKEQYLNIIILKELVMEIITTLIFSVIYMKLKLS